MAKILIVYFSRTGHTEQVARALAEKLGADIEKIRENRSRRGFLGYWRSGREAMSGKLPKIEPIEHDPAEYDLVLLGSPVWASHPSSPMSAFLAANKDKLKQIACFVTMGGAGADKTMARMADAAGKPALASFAASERDVKSGAWKDGAERFAEAVAKAG
jgi:flavodoxin